MMHIIEVNNSKTARDFLQVAVEIYKSDNNWIQPLNKDIEDKFNPQKNKLFAEGAKAIRWILESDGKLIGRIAAFINPNYKEEQPTGGIGFFECINDKKAAHLLFDTAKQWLETQGIEAMDGPINFGERDQWWGLLVEGFQEPLYNMNYNLPYYQELFESYGFQLYFNQECFEMTMETPISPRMQALHNRLMATNMYKVEHLKLNNLDKYIHDFMTIYNLAWASHGGGKQLTIKQTTNLFRSMKPIIEEKLVWFVYSDNKPIAFWISLPDLNQWFKKMKGKFGLLQKLYFLYLTKFEKLDKAVGIAFGVVPEFQSRGVEALMIIEGRKEIAKSTKVKRYELQWIGDFNPKMIKIAQELGTTRSRRLITYRYLFDRTKPFERHRIL